MPLTNALPQLPQLPIGSNSTNGTLPIPGFGDIDIPAPFNIIGLLTFAQTTFTLFSSLYIAWQNLTARVKANEQLGLDVIATLNSRTESLREVEKDTTPQIADLDREYTLIIYRIQLRNNETFLRRWLTASLIADEIRQLSAQAEKLYQSYLIQVNTAIHVDANHARNGVKKLQEQMDRLLELLAAKSG